MNVLFVDHTSLVSGAQRALLDLIEALPESVVPTVMCPAGQLADLVRELGVRVIEFPGTSGSLRLHPVRTPKAAAEIVASARALRGAARRLGVDVIHANSLRAGLIAGGARALGGPPTVVHVHDALPPSRSARLVRRFLHATTDAAITISDYTTRNYAAPEGHRVHMLHNPLDLARFDPEALSKREARATLGLPQEAELIGLVAQITPWKGQDTAIRAFALARERHPGARLLIVGEPKFVDRATRYDNRTYERSLHEQVRSSGLVDDVEFWGERQDVPAILRALDVALAPSWEEPFGRSVIEAMALRTAVVATNIGGPAEYIEDGVDGLVRPPRDAELWAEAIEGLLDDPAARDAMAARASEKVRGLFDRRQYAARVVEIYEELAEVSAPAASNSGPTRILFVEYLGIVGGGQRSLLELMRAISSSYDVALACPEGQLAVAARASGFRVVTIPESQLTFKLDLRETTRELARSAQARRALVRHIDQIRPDVLHANSLRAGLLVAGVRRRPPMVVHCRDLLPSNLAAAAVKRVLLAQSHTVVAVSRQVATRFAGPRWADRGVEVVDNPVDVDRFDPARVDGAGLRQEVDIEGTPVLGVIAQITHWKGQHRAIEILERLRRTHPHAELLIVGEAKFVTAATRFDNRAYESELHALVERLGLEGAVHFTGEREDAERVLAALDVLLVPSTEEPFGRTIIEAMAMGVPVVATDAGGPPEIIRPGEDGEVVPHDDLEGWADAVRRMVVRGRRIESRHYAIERFTPAQHATRMASIFERAVSSHASRHRG